MYLGFAAAPAAGTDGPGAACTGTRASPVPGGFAQFGMTTAVHIDFKASGRAGRFGTPGEQSAASGSL